MYLCMCENTQQPQGETKKVIAVGIMQDDEQEEDEFFDVVLSNLQPAEGSQLCIPLALAKATVKIIDDDMPGAISFAVIFACFFVFFWLALTTCLFVLF